MIRRTISSVAVATLLLCSSGAIMNLSAVMVPAAPTPAGTNLGLVKVDPYGNSPLTALIDLNGKKIKNVNVTVKGKPNGGISISYAVGPETILTHDGIPVIGLYEDYRSTVVITYTDAYTNKKYEDTHKILTAPIAGKQLDNRNYTSKHRIEVKKIDKAFKNKLFMTNGSNNFAYGSILAWSGKLPQGASLQTSAAPAMGSLAFEAYPILHMIDTQGEFRWWLDPTFLAVEDINLEKRGSLMGVRETDDGSFTFLFGQSWGEFDLTGKVLYKHRLPRGYVDLSHETVEMPNGNVLLRAAKANYLNNEGDYVYTVRDHILEVDRKGRLVRVWDLNKSGLDPYRDTLLKGLDMGAVCLNVDTASLGKTVDSFKIDAPYGDIAGIGTGRNWAHVNSIQYDATDDSIIVSLRHQGTVKLTGDNKVKWVLAPKAGWNKELSTKLLTPVDSKGKKLDCDDNGVCEDTDFDFSWTQHTAWLSPNNTLTVLDNGDGRHNTQPAMKEDKYTRYVEYKIDEDKMTVEQLWEYGKERGSDWYSAVTSNVELITNDGKPYMYGFGGSVGMFDGTKPTKGIHNIIDYKTKKVLAEIIVHANNSYAPHYRGLLMEPQRWFSK